MRIVIVCHEFTRMQRMRSLAQGLSLAGHEVVYVTSETPASQERYRVVSLPYVSAGQKAKGAVRVDANANLADVAGRKGRGVERLVRMAARAYEAALLYPDKYRGWLAAVKRYLVSCPAEVTRADVVIASMMPVTALVAGRRIAEAAGAPLIVDFRDLWTNNAQYGLGPVRRLVDRVSESRILTCANAVTTVTGHLQQELSPRRKDGVVHLIHTGVDAAPWAAARRTPDGVLRFGHMGVWMGGRRTIRPLLDSIRRLADTGEVDTARIRIDMWGEIDDVLLRDTEATGLSAALTYHGRVPMEQLPAELSAVDVALVPTWPQDVWSIPLKTFQYLAAGKTILFIDSTPESEMRRLVADLPGIDYNDTPAQLDDAVRRYYDRVVTRGDTLDWDLSDRPVPVTEVTMAEQFLRVIGEVRAQ